MRPADPRAQAVFIGQAFGLGRPLGVPHHRLASHLRALAFLATMILIVASFGGA